MKLRITVDSQSFEVEVGDLNARPILATIDGETFEVWPAESGKAPAEAVVSAPAAAPVEKPAPAAVPAKGPVAANGSSTDKTKTVAAPIPGVILSISVKEGDAVEFGQELCVLEAMKMKNQIRANRAGKIGAVHIAVGDQVKHNQTLIEYTD